ncbi:MAG: phospholipase [Actinobacteria bacterium]|nr:MAG: phospholipase [Actinomycetota bacterium]
MTPELPDLGLEYRYRPASDGTEGAPKTVLLLHGAGGDESSLLPVGEAVGTHVALLSPRGNVEENGPRYFRRVEPGVPDVEDLHARVDELAQFVARACDAFDLDAAAVWVFGYSNGATTAAALALDHPDVLAGGVLLAARAPFRHHGRVLDGKAFFCGHGRSDDQVSVADYEDVVELLVTAGAEIELHWYDGGHELTDEQVQEATAWLQRQMQKA